MMKKNFVRRAVAALVVCAVLMSGIGMVFANAEDIEYITMYADGTVDVYEEADTESRIVTRMDDAEPVQVFELDAAWYETEAGTFVQTSSLRNEQYTEAPEEEPETVEAPVIAEAPAVREEHAAEEAVTEETVAEAAAEEPAAEEETTEAETAEEPVTEETIEEEPVTVEETVEEASAAEEETAEESAAEETAEETEVKEETAVEETAVEDETAVEEPAAEEAATEETVTEEPIAEEPTAEEMAEEEPKAEEEPEAASMAEDVTIEESEAVEEVTEEPAAEEEPEAAPAAEDVTVEESEAKEEVTKESTTEEEPVAEETAAEEEAEVPETETAETAEEETVEEIGEYETPLGLRKYEMVVLTAPDQKPVSFREGADETAAVIAELGKDAEIIVIGVEGNWANAVVGGERGYIYLEDIRSYLFPETGTVQIAEIETETPAETVQAAEDETEESKEDMEDPTANMKVTIFSSQQGTIHIGETVDLCSKIEGFDGYEVRYQWVCDKHDGNSFQNVEGANESTFSFIASAETMSWDWQLLVYLV